MGSFTYCFLQRVAGNEHETVKVHLRPTFIYLLRNFLHFLIFFLPPGRGGVRGRDNVVVNDSISATESKGRHPDWVIGRITPRRSK